MEKQGHPHFPHDISLRHAAAPDKKASPREDFRLHGERPYEKRRLPTLPLAQYHRRARA